MRAEIRILAILLAATALAGCKDETQAEKAPRPIRSVVAHAQVIGETISQTGEIRPRHETPLGFRIGGELRTRLETGQVVKAGQVVATIDDVPARNDLLSAQAEVEVAEAGAGQAEQAAQRAQDLFARAVASRVQVQDTETALRTARARVELARASLAKAKDQLSYTELRAPHDGVVATTSANAGQALQAGQTVLTLVSDTERDAVFDVPERIVREPRVADRPIEVSLISDPSVHVTGKVREVAPASDSGTRTFRVKVALDDKATVMPLGAAVDGRVTLDGKSVFPLPASALTREGDTPAVFIFDPASKTLHLRPVTVARYDGAQIVIADGLTDGDIVASAGVSRLRDGERVLQDQGEGK